MALVRQDSRNCFGLEWYDSEAEAVDAGRRHTEAGETVNGGWLDGMPCGRSPEFDYEDAKMGRKLYATRTG